MESPAFPDKARLRKDILSRRDSLTRDSKEAKDSLIRERITGLPEFTSARSVLLYASFRSEADTIGLIRYCLQNNKVTVLPKVNNGELLLYRINKMDELLPGNWGIPEPFVPEDRRVDVRDVDLVIVPGSAFDEQGNRLGYGKGFYDKLLKSKRSPAIALSYEDQIVPALPAESHDVRMDKIVTDKRIIDCNEQQED